METRESGRRMSPIAGLLDPTYNTFTGKRRYWLTAAFALAMISVLTLLVRLGITSQCDRAVISWISGHRSGTATALFEGVTYATRWQSYAMACFIGVTLFAALGYWRRSMALTAAAIASGFVLFVMQFVMSESAQQVRPADFNSTLSFPSGHSLSGVMLFGFVIFLLLHHSLEVRVRPVLITLATALLLLSAAARMYLLLHWPSDVAGSFLLGTVGLAVAIPVYLAVERERWSPPRNPLSFDVTPAIDAGGKIEADHVERNAI